MLGEQSLAFKDISRRGRRYCWRWIVRRGLSLVSLSLMPYGLSMDAVAQAAAGGTEDPAQPREQQSAVDADLEQAQKRELGAEEDPQAASQAAREAESAAEEAAGKVRSTGFDVYGSARVRLREDQGVWDLQDGSSRLGADGDWQFSKGFYLIGRYEMGFNVLSGVESLSIPGESAGEVFQKSVFTRLAHIGLEGKRMSLFAGKNWSTYYEVASFTDRFMSTGASASGTFNAQTDGGPTGTGRADATLQAKLSTDFLPRWVFKPFDLNIQVQQDNPIPFADNANYGTAVGVSAVLTTHKELTIGLAYNFAEIDLERNPGLRAIGLAGNAHAWLLGFRDFGDRWYAGAVLARLVNHETTDQGNYFDGWGSEVYAQYRLLDKLWFIGGYNVLRPDSGQLLAGDYRLLYGVAGLRYTFQDFRRMVYFNIRIDDSVSADGSTGANVLTVGFRWDLSNRGWHVSD